MHPWTWPRVLQENQRLWKMCTASLPYGSADESERHKRAQAGTDWRTCEALTHASTEINLGICLKRLKMKWLSIPLKNWLGGVITLWKPGAHNRHAEFTQVFPEVLLTSTLKYTFFLRPTSFPSICVHSAGSNVGTTVIQQLLGPLYFRKLDRGEKFPPPHTHRSSKGHTRLNPNLVSNWKLDCRTTARLKCDITTLAAENSGPEIWIYYSILQRQNVTQSWNVLDYFMIQSLESSFNSLKLQGKAKRRWDPKTRLLTALICKLSKSFSI